MNAKQTYLEATYYIDCDTEAITFFARGATEGAESPKEKAVRLYYAVRDGIQYNPYALTFSKEDYRASGVLRKKEGFCVQKAVVLAAAARACDIPSRLGFADVRNHLSSPRLREILQTDVFFFHGYVQLDIEGQWVKATPAFDAALCEKAGILPLEFDGVHDSVFHPFDRQGKKHMEYLRDHGIFADLPFEMMKNVICAGYPHLAGYIEQVHGEGDFHSEVSSDLS